MSKRIPQHAHPLVRALFEMMNERRITYGRLGADTGIHAVTIRKWRAEQMPRLDTFDAVLTALGFELVIRPVGTRDRDRQQGRAR